MLSHPIYISHDGCLCDGCLTRHSGNMFEILRIQLDGHIIKTDIVNIVDNIVQKVETMDEKCKDELSVENAKMYYPDEVIYVSL